MRFANRPALFVSLIVCRLLYTSPASALDLADKITPLADPLVDDGQVVGLVVGVFRNGESQFLAYGETAKGSGEKPTEKTVYEIGSATKAITGVLLADMVRRGELKLDAPLQSLLPADVKLDVFDGKPITLEHVATHSSGLPRLPDNLKPADPTNPYADFTPEQMYEFLRKHKLSRAPGKYEYSNLAMGLLGHELARSRKLTYEELFLQRIARPLKMSDTRIALDADQSRRLAKPYNAALEPEKNWDIPTLAGAGGIRSTAADMLKFVEANLADDEKPLTQSIRLSHEKRFGPESGPAVALGWHIAGDGITRWHNGMTGGYASWVSIVPKYGVGVVVLSNTASPEIDKLGELITRLACGDDVPPPARRTVVAVPLATLKSYEGTYPLSPAFALTVTVEAGKLMVQATGQQKLEVFAESPTKFFYKVVDAQLTFEPGPEGRAESVTLHQNGLDQKAKRSK
jgi:serine-type D-Ala-D-Ala carboxypeptidase/endopeptidase